MRIALGIEYDGTAYNGWQRQRRGVGIQTAVEDALSKVADEPIETICAGRTDTGVHAVAQVVHFDSKAERTTRGWVLGVNSNLPDDINACWAKVVNEDFHARFSVTSRSYRYLILNRPVRSSLYRNRAWCIHQPLNEADMEQAADSLLGEHDFSAFRAAGCQGIDSGARNNRYPDLPGWSLDKYRRDSQRVPAAHGSQHRRTTGHDRAGRRAPRLGKKCTRKS